MRDSVFNDSIFNGYKGKVVTEIGSPELGGSGTGTERTLRTCLSHATVLKGGGVHASCLGEAERQDGGAGVMMALHT
eukprot:169921-Chlamydomonas_euryale.AAC.1